VLQIREVDPGSKIFHPRSRVKKISDSGSGSALKNLSIFNPKNCFKAQGKIIFDVHPGSGSGFVSLPIPDQGVKKAPDPGSRSATLVAVVSHHVLVVASQYQY
jgi:hypothetical protein